MLFFRWFFSENNIADAEKKLFHVENQSGTYFIQESENHPGHYLLSIRDGVSVQHYYIRKNKSEGFYIHSHVKFNSLDDLIHHYMERQMAFAVD